MSQPSPEFSFYYERLRLVRAAMRRQGYVLLIAAAGLVAFMIFWIGRASPDTTIGPSFFLLFFGLSVLLVCNALVVLWRSHRPISDAEVARTRQQIRKFVFQFAQGRISWQYRLGVTSYFLIGTAFLLLGLRVAWLLTTNLSSSDLVDVVYGLLFLVGGWRLLARAIRGARWLRQLGELSSQELAARLSLGKATEGE